MTFKYDQLTHAAALEILTLPNEKLPELLNTVYAIRKKYKGDVVNIQLLTNARSGNCTQNCAYCAQSNHSQADISKYDFIAYDKFAQDGYKVRDHKLARHCIGFSGICFSDQEIHEFAKNIATLKQETHSPICCSIGFLTPSQAQRLKAAGVDRINHNLNTSRNYYANICTTHTYQERIDNIKMLQSLGFEICCGGIIGLGEDYADVVDMLFEIQSIAPQAVPINFFIPIPGTALEQAKPVNLSPEYCLKVLALARLLNPKADIRCAAGREIYLKGREQEMFYAVDSIFASGYLTTDGQSIDDTIKIITDAGFKYYVEG